MSWRPSGSGGGTPAGDPLGSSTLPPAPSATSKAPVAEPVGGIL